MRNQNMTIQSRRLRCLPMTMHYVQDATASDGMTPREFAAQYSTHVSALYRYFYHHVRNAHDAEDLMATTVDKAFENLHRFDRKRGPFVAWLFGIARHTLHDFHRRRRPTLDIAQIVSPSTDLNSSPDHRVLKDEEKQVLHRYIAKLPSTQREALILRYFSELPTADIASILGRSEGATKLLVHRALTALRERYRQEGQR